MFENFGTALVQAVGFFGVFGFFVFQLLSEDKQPIKTKSKSPNQNINQPNDKPKKSGLFGRKTEPIVNLEKPKKSGLFGRKTEPIVNLEKPKKKGWFNNWIST